MGPIFQALSYAFPKQKWLARANVDFNEAFNYAEAGGRNSYWFLNPNQLRTDLNRPKYQSYSKMPKRAIVVTPSPRKRSRTRMMTVRYARPLKYRRRYRRRSAWKAAARREVGNRANMNNCKRSVNNLIANDLGKATRTIHQFPLIKIAKGTQIDQRLRQIVNMRGFKIELNMINVTQNLLICNWAVVHPKTTGIKVDEAGQTFPTQELFRGYNQSRSQNPTTTLAGVQWCNAKINTDQFAVLKRGRFILNPGRDAPVDPGTGEIIYFPEKGSNLRMKQLWVPLRRQCAWDTNISNDYPVDQVFFVYWLDAPMSPTGKLPQPDAVAIETRVIQYFRETRD